jgi:hypothetical protein
MKYIQTFESFSQVNEITRNDDTKIKSLLVKLKDKIKDSQIFSKVKDFISMEILDAYATYDDIINHLQLQFPQIFGKGKQYATVLEEWMAEAEQQKR